MDLDQLLVRLRLAWRHQRQQVQYTGGALLILLCLVLWERSQWTQPTPSDLLHDLPQAQPEYNTGAPSSGNSDLSSDWSCHNSAAWFQKQSHRWHEVEDLAGWLCRLDTTSTSEQFTVDKADRADLAYPQIITQLQAQVITTEDDASRTRQLVAALCQNKDPAKPSTAALCDKLLANDSNSTQAVGLLLLTTTEPDDSWLTFEEYQNAHPGKTMFGLNSMMTGPRFFSFALWLSSSDFPSKARHIALEKIGTNASPVGNMLQALQCSLTGIALFVFFPGIQTILYALAFMDQHPLLAGWVMLMGLANTVTEAYCLYICWVGTQAAFEKSSSLVGSHLLSPLANIFVSICYMGLQLFMPAFLFDALYIMHVGLAPPLTVWISITFMEVSGIGNDAAAALAAGAPAALLGQPRNAFAAVWGEGWGVPAGPGGPDLPHARPDTPGRDHRSRDRDHRHKEVHWPPPLSVPEHLEDLEVPDSFKCPITFAIMKEPATTRNGLTYDRPAIMQWIQQHRRDPTTAQKLKAHHLSPNLSLRTVIQSWVDTNK